MRLIFSGLENSTAARVAAVLAGWFVLACSSGARSSTSVSPATVATLEAAVGLHPDDPAANLRLGEAYYAAGRFADARRSVGTTLRKQPKNDQAQVYLGLSYEGLVQLDSARAAYTTLLASQPSKALHRMLVGRLAIVARGELLQAARQAIANESLLAATAPDRNTIAVMPFRFAGGDSAFRPLERGLAAVVVTDLSRVHELRVVERARLQALLDELALAESDKVDPATGARSGRLLRAGQVVQGQFTADAASRIRIDATVVRATDAQVAATGSNADQIRALFDIEKAVVFQLLDQLGITLTPAERVAISERPTRDIQAFLLYSRGLEEADRGDFSAAAASFGSAAARDPGFHAATQQAASTQAAQAASLTSAADLATAAGTQSSSPGAPSPSGGALAAAINGAVPTGAGLIEAVSNPGAGAVPTTDPNRICEGATCDGPARAALIGAIIVIVKLP